MTEENDKPGINPGYPLGQLVKALSSAGERATLRVKQWRRVIAGMFDGTLRIGSRAPVASIPPWVTLEVVHGGFATGNLAAGGPLLPHESSKLEGLSALSQASERGALNSHFLEDVGRGELVAMLTDGRFRVHVPEEAALLVVVWLLERGDAKRAGKLIEAISPFFDRLRFYPAPHSRPVRTGTAVCVETAGESAARLRAKRPQRSVERMKEAIRVWTPLHDRATALFLETVEGAMPALRTTASGKLMRQPNGQPIVDGGWPCRHYAEDWRARAQQLLVDHRDARARHRLCGKPEAPKENFARLRGYLEKCVQDPRSLTGRDVGMIRKILASQVTRHGAPGSSRLQRTRAEQARSAARPLHHSIAGVLAQRLEQYPQDEGVPDLVTALGPLSAEEASRVDASVGEPLPAPVVAKAMRCLEAPIESLVAQGLLPSSESMARVLPLLTAQVRAAAIGDPQLRRIYQAVYVAFRRRRSLLLLDLESQVKLGELPWISVIEPWVGSDTASREAARASLTQAATLAIDGFPHTLLPNTLIKELRALAAGAGVSLPLVDELAADIFMGAFSSSFLRAAQTAARLLEGTLYERYYGLPYQQVLQLDDVEQQRFGAPVSPGFARLCQDLAGAKDGAPWSVARNGTIIEHAQILTTHNLATLFTGLDLRRTLRGKLPLLARRCFQWICRRQQMRIDDWRAQLQMMKNTAYAWRQMVFYLSLMEPAETGAFLEWSAEHLGDQKDEFRQHFEPVMAGLCAVAAGDRFGADGNHPTSGGRRFLGWSIGPHWLKQRRREVAGARG